MCAFPGPGATGRARNSVRGPVVNPLQHGPGGVVDDDIAPREDPLGDLQESLSAHAAAARASPGERGDVLGRAHAVEDVRAGADPGYHALYRSYCLFGVVLDQVAGNL